jgi:Carboxypeptidase regulatory-like domain
MRHAFYAGAALAALIAPVAIHAQDTTSSIRGSVTSGGAAVANAEVVIVHEPTGSRTTTMTTADGSFSAQGLRVGGPFTVTVTAPGLPESTVTEIFTQAGTPFSIPIEIAAAGDEIIVTASKLGGAGNVSQGPATVLNAADIANVVSFNRDVRDLSRRDPFATIDLTNNRAVSFAGQNPRFNRFSVDGVAISDSFGLNPDGLPSRRGPVPFDAIGQYQVKIAPFDIREGNFQGGAINVVLKSGSNEFTGTGFYSYSSDKITGDEVDGVRVNLPKFKSENYGVHIAGPIIKDKLFFALTAERVRANNPITAGSIDVAGPGVGVPNLTSALITQISGIAQSIYNYDTGGVVTGDQDQDDRLVAKIDANISDTQRLALTYTYTDDSQIIPQNTSISASSPSLGLESNAYTQTNTLHVGVAQLNSEWSDNFSTELRGFYVDYVRGQDPLLGRGFAQFQVCATPTSDRTAVGAPAANSTSCPSGVPQVSFGPDVSRQSNALNTQTYGFSFVPRLKAGNHDLQLLVEFSSKDVNNLFLQRTAGDYYFDSIADLQARTAQRFRYQNAISLNTDDAAAIFGYETYTFGISDTWRVNDALNLNIGLRYDLFGGESAAVNNPNFVSRYGFRSNAFIDGKGVIQPRFGFDFKASSRLTFRGGAGIFAGGTPDVYVSNSFSNTGVITSSIDVRQNNNGTFTGATPAQGTGALTNVSGTTIPAVSNAQLQGLTAAAASTTNALAPDFKIPRQLRATFGATYDADLGPLGDDWTFTLNGIYSKVLQQVAFTDLRSRATTLLTPDGRTRYVGVISQADTNNDILLTNTTKGRSIAVAVGFDKKWDFGLNIGGSYTFQDITDQSPSTSSVALSNYQNGAFLDANIAALGTSNDEIKHQFKYYLNFEREFFGDYKSKFSFFGESRTGRPFSYTFQDPATGRSPVFGTTGSNARYLVYVPTGPNDPLVSYDTLASQTAFESFIESSGLGKFRGSIAKRNAFRSPWYTKIDFRFEQELPGFISDKSRFSVFADIENLGNLINSKYGVLEQFSFPFTQSVVRVACLQAPVATGTTPTAAQTVTSSAQNCAQYRYSSPVTPARTISTRQSLYTIRVGARFSF